MKIERAALALLLVFAVGCGKKDADKKTPDKPAAEAPTPAAEPPAKPAADPAANPAADLAPKGDDLDRLCGFYATAMEDQAEMSEEPVKGDPAATCKQTMAARTPAERQEIADCANACGDMEGVVDCFNDFGKDTFPACGDEEEEMMGEEDDE